MSRSRLNRALESTVLSHRRTGRGYAIILFSIDRFRLINSRFGYAFADRVLSRIEDTAQTIIKAPGRVGKWGGDEFLCILPDTDARGAAQLARELSEKISRMIVAIDTNLVNVTASFGTACAPTDGNEPDALLSAADEALYEAKRTGRNRIVAASDLDRRVFQMAGVLEAALRENRIVPAYQPIVELASGRVVAEEALARIALVDGNALTADLFINAASHFQLTYKIDATILHHTIGRCTGRADDIAHFVNISGDLLRHPQLLADLLADAQRRLPDRGGCKPLVIEVTEREFLENMDVTRGRLAPFLDFGIRLALDDFGSGYSSFQYLADLPVSFLKIDGQLVKRVHETKVFAILRAIQTIATDLDLITLAEYIETEQQADLLRHIGVAWGQGHHFGAAVLDQHAAEQRREMSVNWAQGYYYQKPALDHP
ncbi:MAG: EAL domain-containing protein [Acidiferrobacter sp.]